MNIWLWLSIIAMAGLAVGILALPLTRASRRGRVGEREDYDLRVYRDQLAEIDRDLHRGVLGSEQAEAARLEVQRRMLAASPAKGKGAPEGPGEAAATSPRRARNVLIVLIAVLVPAAALGLYLQLGAPGVPSMPLADRDLGAEGHSDQRLRALIAEARAHLEENPDDARAWKILGDARRRLGEYRESAEAYRKALLTGAINPDIMADYAEMLVAANDGQVVPRAREGFDVVLRVDPGNFRARYYLGVALTQEGRREEALDHWLDLAADTPADARWRPILERQIRQTATELEIGLGTIPSAPAEAPAAEGGEAAGEGTVPGPSAADVEAAGEMSEAERDAFIRSMVERLAARLEENPNDLEGWLRLGRSYRVLGETDEARAAFEKAVELAGDLPPDAPLRKAAEDSLSELSAE